MEWHRNPPWMASQKNKPKRQDSTSRKNDTKKTTKKSATQKSAALPLKKTLYFNP